MSICTIMVGVPGTGKSTRIGQLYPVHYCPMLPPGPTSDYLRENAPCWVVSADHYFIGADGSYNWNADGLSKAHRNCYHRFFHALGLGVDVVVDNTNLKHRVRREYLEAATARGYEIRVEVLAPVPGRKNIHCVPEAQVQKMLLGQDIEAGTYTWTLESGYRRLDDSQR